MLLAPKLLITDDDDDLRESLAAAFAARGLDTVQAADGQEAYDVVQRQDIHLVLMDFHMPRMTGLEALRLIKKFDQRLPVILMSAGLDPAISREVWEADAFAIHSKPIDMARIRHDVSNALHKVYNWLIDC